MVDKFKTNKFAKKYKKSLDEFRKDYTYGADTAEDMVDSTLYAWETANQVKSWNRSPISETVNVTYLFLAFIIGFSVCAIVVTPLVINSI